MSGDMQHEHARRASTERVGYTITPWPGSDLHEVVVNATSGAFSLQDYLTVTQARQLANALTAVADMCEAAA